MRYLHQIRTKGDNQPITVIGDIITTSSTRGFTLLEAIIYIGLLSGLFLNLIPYVYSTNTNNSKLLGAISDAGPP